MSETRLDWQVGQLAEVEYNVTARRTRTDRAVYCSEGARRYWRPWNPYLPGIRTEDVKAIRPLVVGAEDAILGMCHWVQDRDGVQAEETHEQFHYDSPCPYKVVAEVLAGRPDPRDEVPACG